MLPDEKGATANKPFLGQSPSPISLPYVPPLANTFASTNVNTIPMVPNTGKSDAEIVFAGVSNLNLNNAPTVPPSLVSDPQSQQQQQQPILQPQPNVIPASLPQEVGSAAGEQTIQPHPAANATLPPANYQHAPVFGTVQPTSIPSLNESFNIPTSVTPSGVPASVYQTNPVQGKTSD